MPPNMDKIYYSRSFIEVIYYFKYGFKSDESVFLVTGNYGYGKTTLCKKLIKSFKKHNNIDYVYFSTPSYDYDSILKKISAYYSIEIDPDRELQESVFEYFFNPENCKKLYLFIDDANELDLATLSKLRFLVDFNYNGFYPFRLILFAHDSFLQILQRPELLPLKLRIRRRTQLQPLSVEETLKYIQFRLSKVSTGKGPVFTVGGVWKIHAFSHGNPRTIHTLCDACLILGAMEGLKTLDAPLVGRALCLSGLDGSTPEGEFRATMERKPKSIGKIGDHGAAAWKPPVAWPNGEQRLARVSTREVSRLDLEPSKFSRSQGRGLRFFILLILLSLAAMLITSFLDVGSFFTLQW